MFNLFKKIEKVVNVFDKVTISATAKFKAMLSQWENDSNMAFVFWFDESLRQAESFFINQATKPIALLSAKEAASSHLAGKNPVFGEHYPIRTKEEELFNKMKLQSVIVFSSLDEPLLKHFGGEKIIHLMKQLGMKEDEIIEHKMVSKAIRNAQDKIGKKVLVEQSAHTQQDWFEKNYNS